ncbi:hypothetical protein BV22DRAFT_1024156, partial [Leucogyrophana mollusca]
QHEKNVLVMSTSNLARAIDSAFVDRADIIQYIDLPTREAIYEIPRSALWAFGQEGDRARNGAVRFSFTSRRPFPSLFVFALILWSDFNFNFVPLPSC